LATKKANPPHANMLFDVRFLKNPFWVEELRPLTGLDLPVRRYVMEQEAANAFFGKLAFNAGSSIAFDV
jgi:UPF0042 nucleotide-binding protein